MDNYQDYLFRFNHFLNQHFPLSNPVLILALTLLIILFSPLLSKRFRIPGIIGLIIAGIVIGPHSLHIIESTASFELLSETGLLYIMFLAGLEIDMQEFKHNRNKSIVFGFLTFIIPILIGFIVCTYIFHFSFWSSLLLASMFSTHTLLSYPIVSNMGIVKNKAVQVAFGGTIITDTAVLVLLAFITNSVSSGFSEMFFVKIMFSLGLLGFSTMYLLPKLSRWFFRNIEAQASSQYIYVLAMVFISGFLSDLAGVEPIIGAFLAGLGLNKVIPHNGILMNRINFIGNTLFIPFFLISSGMLVDLGLFFKGYNALVFAGILSLVGLITKFLASDITARIYNYTKDERNILFGLSVSHAAATLAIIKVGFDVNLFDQNVVNGTVILILVSCLASSFVTEKAARKIAIVEKDVVKRGTEKPERILIPVSNPENIQRLIDLALLIKDQNSLEPIYPLSIVEDDAEADEKINLVKRVIEGVAEQIASSDKKVEVLKKVDLSIVDGIIRTARAYNISDIIISYRSNTATSHLLFGNTADNLLVKSKQALIISKVLQPINTFQRVIVLLSPNAEKETGFLHSVNKINSLLKQTGNTTILYGTESTLMVFSQLVNDQKKNFYTYKPLDSFENYQIINELKTDDLFVFLSSRTQTLSYDFYVDDMPKLLNKASEFTSFVVFYPSLSKTLQEGVISDITTTKIGQKYEKMKHLTEKVTGRFKKDDKQQSNS